jgi:hypothetical protein
MRFWPLRDACGSVRGDWPWVLDNAKLDCTLRLLNQVVKHACANRETKRPPTECPEAKPSDVPASTMRGTVHDRERCYPAGGDANQEHDAEVSTLDPGHATIQPVLVRSDAINIEGALQCNDIGRSAASSITDRATRKTFGIPTDRQFNRTKRQRIRLSRVDATEPTGRGGGCAPLWGRFSAVRG